MSVHCRIMQINGLRSMANIYLFVYLLLLTFLWGEYLTAPAALGCVKVMEDDQPVSRMVFFALEFGKMYRAGVGENVSCYGAGTIYFHQSIGTL